MDAQEFLELVLPSEGNKILALAETSSEGRTWFKYKTFPDTKALARAVRNFDSDGRTVYFAVNSFGDWYEDERTGKKRLRTQDNVVACRSLFDDFDVDPAKNDKARELGKPLAAYNTQAEAMADIVKLAKTLRLTPTITSSGGGFHVYFVLDRDITPAEWEDLSAMKRDITKHLNIRADRAVDVDSARILRPVGAHNLKYDPPRVVTVAKAGKTYSPEHVRAKLEEYIKANNVAPAPSANKVKGGMVNRFAAALGEYPPSYPDKIADLCNAIKEFRDTGGDIPEPHWHRAIGVLKHCEGGEEKIHEWSSGYEGYTPQETQGKIDEWATGPTSCEQMDSIIGCRAKCPFATKCSNPIQLGYVEDSGSVDALNKSDDNGDEEADDSSAPEASAPKAAAPKAKMPNGATIEGQIIPWWPAQGYRWNGAMLSRAHTDEDGIVQWRPFCRSFAFPLNRVRDAEGTWVIQWRAKEKNGAWRDFFMPTSELASTDMMAKTLAANEVFLARTKNARSDMAEFTEGLVETLQEWRVETKTYKQFGWAENYTGFILGTTMITAKGEQPVLCDDTVPSDIALDFGQSGTVDDWVRNIDKLYNRPDAEPFQFALCHAMGSVLVEMFGSSNWHGLPLAFTGAGGTGKSTACKIACGFFGRPKLMERQTGEQGSTLNAAIKRIGAMGSVPVLLDEFSGRTPDELTRTGYALANGRDKERLSSSGKFATTGDEWYKNSFITSNDSLQEAISTLKAGYRTEATQLRYFEVKLPKDYRNNVYADITQQFIEHHMDNVYGAAFRPYIRFIIKNQDWVRKQIAAARGKFNPKSEDDNKERFYRDAVVTALVAGRIAEKIGLIQFDLKSMKRWATEQIIGMRESRKSSNTDISEHLAQFIASLPGQLIVTKRYGDNRNKTAVEYHQPLRVPAVGRVCTEDKLVYLTVKCISDWCKDNGVALTDLREEMDRVDLLVRLSDGKPSQLKRIANGTDLPAITARCVQMNYDKLFGGTSLQVVGGTQLETAQTQGEA
jgi:hypothetical protein